MTYAHAAAGDEHAAPLERAGHREVASHVARTCYKILVQPTEADSKRSASNVRSPPHHAGTSGISWRSSIAMWSFSRSLRLFRRLS